MSYILEQNLKNSETKNIGVAHFSKKRYKIFLNNFNEEIQPHLIYNQGKWTDYVNERLKGKRDLIIVAGMTKYQRIKLIKNDIKNIDDFAL